MVIFFFIQFMNEKVHHSYIEFILILLEIIWKYTQEMRGNAWAKLIWRSSDSNSRVGTKGIGLLVQKLLSQNW